MCSDNGCTAASDKCCFAVCDDNSFDKFVIPLHQSLMILNVPEVC
jgi:hypothetical protein